MEGLPLPRRLYAIGALGFGTALVVIDGGIVNVALPTIARDLHTDQSSVVAIVTVYQLTLVMLMLPFAALGERVGLKRLYQWGQLVFTVATLLCFFARSLPFLLVVAGGAGDRGCGGAQPVVGADPAGLSGAAAGARAGHQFGSRGELGGRGPDHWRAGPGDRALAMGVRQRGAVRDRLARARPRAARRCRCGAIRSTCWAP